MEDVLGIVGNTITIQTIKQIGLIPVGYVDTITVTDNNYYSIERAFVYDGSIIIKQIGNVKIM